MTTMETAQAGGINGMEAEATTKGPVRAAVGAVLHFFAHQMTTSRPEQAMQGMVQRSGARGYEPLGEFPPSWVEAGRV